MNHFSEFLKVLLKGSKSLFMVSVWLFSLGIFSLKFELPTIFSLASSFLTSFIFWHLYDFFAKIIKKMHPESLAKKIVLDYYCEADAIVKTGRFGKANRTLFIECEQKLNDVFKKHQSAALSLKDIQLKNSTISDLAERHEDMRRDLVNSYGSNGWLAN